MKHFLSLLLAGIIGGLIAFGAMQFYTTNQVQSAKDVNYYTQQVNNPLANKSRSAAFPANFTEAAQKTMPAVVHIKTTSKMPQGAGERGTNPFEQFFGEGFSFEMPRGPIQGSGSGVIISADGYIVTNNHVVGNADKLEVTTYDNRTFSATVIGTDPKTDLAVIKIEESNLPTLDYADSNEAQVGEWVLAVGNPFDLTSTVTAGIISAKGRSINNRQSSKIESFIQTDAAVNPGNSGGALVDESGRLLGINTAIATRTGSFAGYSFAIPVNMMRKIAKDIIEFGTYQRAFLGVSISEMDDELAEELGVNISQGVFVQELIDGGAASYAGVLPRDIIVAVNERPIKTVPELQEVVGTAQVGDVINLKINRKGNIQEIPVRLKSE